MKCVGTDNQLLSVGVVLQHNVAVLSVHGAIMVNKENELVVRMWLKSEDW